MSALVFWLLLVIAGWIVGWSQGHHTGVLEGRALNELQRAFERPLRKVKL